MIQNWWSTRETREKWLFGILLAIVVILVLVDGVIRPWRDSLSNQQALLTQQHNTITTAEKLVAQIQSLQRAGAHLTSPMALDLSNQVQRSLNQAGLANYLTQAKQPTGNQVSLTFNAVPFDQLAAWLTHLTQIYALKVTAWSTQSSEKPGAVYSEITLNS